MLLAISSVTAMDNSTTDDNCLEETTNVSVMSASENMNMEDNLEDSIVKSNEYDLMQCIDNNDPEVISESDDSKLSDGGIKIIANPVTVDAYGGFEYNFKIVDSNGYPVANCHYQYEVDNSQYGGADTNEKGEGYFVYSTSKTLSYGKHPIKIYCDYDSVETYFNVVPDDNDDADSYSDSVNAKKFKSKVKVSKVIKAKPNSKVTIKAKIYHDGSKKAKSGFVKFKINGKTYKSKIKNGVAKVTIKTPKKTKTYVCKATYLGNKNIKSSSAKFKIKVKKTTKFTLVVPAKLNKKIIRSYGKYSVKTHKYIFINSNGKKDATLKIYVLKNGKRFTGFSAKYWIHYNTGGGIWLYSKNVKSLNWKYNYVGYKNVLKVDYVKATVWV